jgi:hypothetical protein
VETIPYVVGLHVVLLVSCGVAQLIACPCEELGFIALFVLECDAG